MKAWSFVLPLMASAWSFGSSKADLQVHKIELGGRVIDLLNGEHFDDILRDTPDELRPASFVLFHRSGDEKCKKKFMSMNYKKHAEDDLPARERIMVSKYDMDLHDKRLHTEFSPEQDLPKRFGVTDCPSLVYVPRACDGHTIWCEEKVTETISNAGCEDFTEQCEGWKFWDGNGDWLTWAKEMIESEPYPKLDTAFGSWDRQESWIRGRDRITTNTHLRNNFLATNLPKFSKTGTKMIKIPDKLYNKLLDFYYMNVPRRTNEPWDVHGATQMNFHEVGTDLVYLDLDPYMRDNLANQYMKPILEEWSGQKLKLNAFYGIREYFPGAWLRNHVDRIDTHIISATLSLLKPNSTHPWPLETVDWSGKRRRYEHKAGEMLLYESSTRPHGRPYRMVDGIHVGCFVHFSPLDESTFRKQLSDGRNTLRGNYTQMSYRSNKKGRPAPEMISRIVTPDNMAEKSNDRRKRVETQNKKTRNRRRGQDEDDGSVNVTFENDLGQDLVLYWVDFSKKPVRNAYMDAKNKAKIKTYPGHQFLFAAPSLKDVEVSLEKFPPVTITKRTRVIKASEFAVGGQLKTDL
mmetsp:Transcript_14314/g.21743  ORF Transcript_14314/g.21743 Transcript_14314/m.21743 type:complete len:576 (-) Transcript_14314:118-1845(-)